RPELGAGLLPPLGRPPPSVRRSRQLFGPRLVRRSGCDPQADAARIPAVGGPANSIFVGWVRGHHRQSGAALRPTRARGVFPAGVLGPGPRVGGHRRQAGRRGSSRNRGTLRRVRSHSTRQLSRRGAAAPPGSGARDVVLPLEGSAVEPPYGLICSLKNRPSSRFRTMSDLPAAWMLTAPFSAAF